MRYKVTFLIEQEVEADSQDEAVTQAWYDIYDEAGASNPDPDWFQSVEEIDDE